jgi:hypothetical protein
MADSNFRGPLSAMGALEVDAGTTASVGPLDGPSAFYQGAGFQDIRAFPFAKDGTAPGRQPAFMGLPTPPTIDAIPMATASNIIVAAASVAATGLLTLVSAPVQNASSPACAIALNVPIVPQGTSSVVTVPIALDFGFTGATTTANSTTVQVYDNTKFTLGQWIYIANCGNTAGTTGLFTQVLGISSTNFTTITVSNAPATAISAPVGQAALYGATLYPPTANYGPQSPVPVSVNPNIQAGLYRMHNPAEALARNVYLEVQPSGTSVGTATILVTGYDVWRQLMTEQIAVELNTTTAIAYGKKAFKYISSISNTVLGTTSTVTVGVGDVFGFPIRADFASQVLVYAGATAVVSNVGFTAAVSTTGSPATNTTGDVRGTIQLSAAGGGTPITNAATTNGVVRLTVISNVGVWNMISGTPLNTVPIFGNAQSST